MRGLSQNKRLWLAAGATVAIVTVLVGWFGVIQPELSAASATRDLVDSTQLQNTVLEAKNGRLKALNDAAELRAGLVGALAELPSDGGVPAFTRQLSAQATATSVELTSVIVGAPTPFAAESGANADTGDTTDTGTTSTSDASPDALVQMTISVTAIGAGKDLQAFVREVQQTGPRRALVTESQLTQSEDGKRGIDGRSTLTLTLNIFAAPLSPVDRAALEKLLSHE